MIGPFQISDSKKGFIKFEVALPKNERRRRSRCGGGNCTRHVKTNTTLPKNLSDWQRKGPLKGTKPSAAMLKDEVKRRCPTARCDNWGMKTCVSWLFNTDSDAALVEDPAADSGGSPVATGPVRNSLYSFIHRTIHPCFRFA